MMEKYELIRSNRKTIAIQIKGDGQVVVRAPLRMSNAEVERYVSSKAEWIQKHIDIASSRQSAHSEPLTQEQLQRLADAALQDIPQRVSKYAAIIGVTVGRITIRHQKTRWGSCSAKGNLSFNCLLMLCPEDVRDYVVVHELCHRKEMNHSVHFWREVEKVLPQYAVQRKWLKEKASVLIQ